MSQVFELEARVAFASKTIASTNSSKSRESELRLKVMVEFTPPSVKVRGDFTAKARSKEREAVLPMVTKAMLEFVPPPPPVSSVTQEKVPLAFHWSF